MKKRTTLMAAAFGFALTGLTYAQEEGTGLSASAGVDVTSAYIFRGATVNDDINVNPAASLGLGNFSAGVWGNFNTDSTQFDEIDVTLGYALPIEGPVSVSVGYTEYTYPTQGTTNGALEADRELSVSFGFDDLPGSPSVGVHYGIEGPFLDEGLYIELGAGHSVNLTEANALDLGVTVGYEAGDNFAENGFSHVLLSAGTDVGPAAVSINYVVETDEDVLAVDEEFFISVGVGL